MNLLAQEPRRAGFSSPTPTAPWRRAAPSATNSNGVGTVERFGDAGALDWWQHAYEALQSMKDRSMHVASDDDRDPYLLREKAADWEQCDPLNETTFRVFVSSTFNDLKAERNALQEHLFPALQKLCNTNACRKPLTLNPFVCDNSDQLK